MSYKYLSVNKDGVVTGKVTVSDARFVSIPDGESIIDDEAEVEAYEAAEFAKNEESHARMIAENAEQALLDAETDALKASAYTKLIQLGLSPDEAFAITGSRGN